MKILITGTAGFIGFHLVEKLVKHENTEIVGIDNINDYYDVSLKRARLDLLKPYQNFTFREIDIADKATLEALFLEEKFDIVVNLAAQAGVRYSITNPDAYINSNIIGFFNILERHEAVKPENPVAEGCQLA